MKHRILQTIVVLLAITSSATAQKLTIAPIEVNAGEQAELVVSASNMNKITALQFNLALPQGITLNESSIAKGEAASGHTLSVQALDNGDHLIVLYHTNLGLVGNGTLLRLPVTVGQQAGVFSGDLNTVRMSTALAVSKTSADAAFNITVKAPEQSGDKEEIPFSKFQIWDNATINGNTLTMSSGYKGGSIYIGRDMSQYDYVWIKFSNATGSPNFGITYDEWVRNEDWGPVFASSTASMNGTGIVGIKLDKKTVMVKGNAETGGVGIGDVYSQHVQQITIQGQAGEAQVTVEGIYFGTTAEYIAAGGVVPVRPEPGGSLTLWEGSTVYDGWGVTSTIDAKFFETAQVGDIIYCTVTNVGDDYNPIFKNILDWSNLEDIQKTLVKDGTHFEGRIATEEVLAFLQANGLRFQGVGFTLTKVELRVPSGDVDGISHVLTDSKRNVRYNLAGQKVNAQYKGIVIQNGKKIIK